MENKQKVDTTTHTYEHVTVRRQLIETIIIELIYATIWNIIKHYLPNYKPTWSSSLIEFIFIPTYFLLDFFIFMLFNFFIFYLYSKYR